MYTKIASVFILLFSVFFCTVHPSLITDEFINFINSQQNSWTAGHNFPPHLSVDFIASRLLSHIDPTEAAKLPVVSYDEDTLAKLPQNFDPRLQWPNCPSLNEIRDQGCCGSCWAFGAVTAMTDRVCIFSNGSQQFHFSAEDVLTCSGSGGCHGGYVDSVWDYWVTNGIVSGGEYNSSKGCQPYSVKPNLDHAHCKYQDTPPCTQRCIPGYPVEYKDDKRYGSRAYSINDTDIRNIMAEIYKNGPVEVSFTVYKDFLTYKHGVYKHVTGKEIGGHAVKMMGWGEENGEKYWLLANSWNTVWGNKGFFKFLRGVNHCGIEEGVYTGEPKL